MSKRIFPLVGIVMVASMVYTAVVHACSDLNTMQAFLQAPCDHGASPNVPRGKTDKANCDSIRYGMLSTQVSSSQSALFKLYLIPHQEAAAIVTLSLSDSLPLFWRSQAPPFSGLGDSPHLSHVVLRI